VEVMACPSGCINGGGQLKSSDETSLKEWIARMETAYKSVAAASPEESQLAKRLYK
jgi:iron only hydrogenase large subunit-like protein